MPNAAKCLYGFAWGRVLQLLFGDGQGPVGRRLAADGAAGLGPYARHAAQAPAPDDSLCDRGGLASCWPRPRHAARYRDNSPLLPEEEQGSDGHAAGKHQCIAPWPEADLAGRSREIEARFAKFQEVLRAVRDIPQFGRTCRRRKQIDFAVRCDVATAELLKTDGALFHLQGTSPAHRWGPDVCPPKLSANVALTGMEVFVDLADLIDVAAEVERKTQEIAACKD